jgi:hypothetical protein
MLIVYPDDYALSHHVKKGSIYEIKKSVIAEKRFCLAQA